MKKSAPIYTSYFIPPDIRTGAKSPALLNLNIHEAGYFALAEGHHIKRNKFKEFILIYCVKGSGFFITGNKRHDVNPGDIAIGFKGMDHEYGAKSGNPWTIYWAHFDGVSAPHLLDNMQASSSNLVLSLSNKLQVIPYFEEMLSTLKSGYHDRNLISGAACFQHILGRMAKDLQDKHNMQGDVTLNNVIDFMVKNVTSTLSLSDMAEAARMSRSNFCRTFHKNTGYPPQNYFIRLKMMKACEILETTDLRITEIADKLDYPDKYYFSRLFKNITGSSPRTYRNAHRK